MHPSTYRSFPPYYIDNHILYCNDTKPIMWFMGMKQFWLNRLNVYVQPASVRGEWVTMFHYCGWWYIAISLWLNRKVKARLLMFSLVSKIKEAPIKQALIPQFLVPFIFVVLCICCRVSYCHGNNPPSPYKYSQLFTRSEKVDVSWISITNFHCRI